MCMCFIISFFVLYISIWFSIFFFPQDYGTLLCWASNEIGDQMEPCVYTITPAGKWNSQCKRIFVQHCKVSCIVFIQPSISGTKIGVVNCFCCYIMLIYHNESLFGLFVYADIIFQFSWHFIVPKIQTIKTEMASVATDKQTIRQSVAFMLYVFTNYNFCLLWSL